MTLTIFAAITFLLFQSIPAVLALLPHIYLIRSIPDAFGALDCIGDNCQISNDPILGLALPILIFSLILIIYRKNYYSWEKLDIFFIFYIFTLIIGCLYSPNLISSIDFTARFILIGAPFFFIYKKYFTSNLNYIEKIQEFNFYTYICGIIIGIAGFYFYISPDFTSIRLSIPGAHPIPFSLLIGYATILSIGDLLSNNEIFGKKNKIFKIFNAISCFALILCQLASNTRGVTIAMTIAILLFLIIYKHALNTTRILFFIPIFSLITWYLIEFIGTEFLFQRFSNFYNDDSIGERSQAYQDVWDLWGKNPILGIGTDGFQHLASLPYPHNLFLENVVSFGVLGFILNMLLFIILFLFFIKTINKRASALHVVAFTSCIFFFIEVQFSFSIWMHKLFYLSLGILSVLWTKDHNSRTIA